MSQLKPVRGTQDILPDENAGFRHVEAAAAQVAKRFGYGEISTPIFEFTEVFSRTLGDTSDIVSKEMYTFDDRGGSELTLRPEGTAGVARAFISNGLHQELPLKYYYRGPMFRYERPQKGRRRQFHQVGIELLGVAGWHGDVEVISFAHQFLDALGLAGSVTLEINSLGDNDSRRAYRQRLVEYFSARKEELSGDSIERLKSNPLRILDSKDERDRVIVAGAPLLSDHLNAESAAFFQKVLTGLEALGIAYQINPKLVRGLDYYSHTAFEFTSTDLGAQGTVLAGGRYDGLIAQMGGRETPGIGWAAGVERLAMLAKPPEDTVRPIAVIPLGADAETIALTLTHRLRADGFAVDQGYSGNMGKRMKRADKLKAGTAVILGDDELAKNVATVRNMVTGDQEEIPLENLSEYLKGIEAGS